MRLSMIEKVSSFTDCGATRLYFPRISSPAENVTVPRICPFSTGAATSVARSILLDFTFLALFDKNRLCLRNAWLNRLNDTVDNVYFGNKSRVNVRRNRCVVCKAPVEHCFCSFKSVGAVFTAHNNGNKVSAVSLCACRNAASCF